ncbi:hypothetical protein [Aquirufa ecclesiirivi]|uniref:hypothetical protein n=1 Tax=Aquirufa ecclesiirivi TaxID=2715124 RepID=UPI003BAF5051
MEANPSISVKIEEGVKELRIGQAPNIEHKKGFSITGTIDTPLKWFNARKEAIDKSDAHILVSYENGTITLVMNTMTESIKTQITGKIEPSDDISKAISINKGVYITTHKMGETFKMNKSLFINKSEAEVLVSGLMNLEVKVSQVIQDANDNRGNVKVLQSQAIKSNIPEVILMQIAPFKGSKRAPVEVNVYINPENYTCTLVSAGLKELIDNASKEMIDLQIEELSKIIPKEIPILIV